MSKDDFLYSKEVYVGQLLSLLNGPAAAFLSVLSRRVIEMDPIFAESAGYNVEFYNETKRAIVELGVDSKRLSDIHSEFYSKYVIPGIVDQNGNLVNVKSRIYQEIVLDVRTVNEKLINIIAGNPSVMYELPPKKFEEIIAELLTRMNYEVTLTPQTRDGGFDMYAAHKNELGTFLYLIECKRYQPINKVGVNVVRSLNGILEPHNATAGVVITTSFFTKDAIDFTKKIKYRLSLVDYIKLQEWFAKNTINR